MFYKKVISLSKEEIAYYDINPKATNILVCIHGNFSSSTFLEPLFAEFPNKVRIIAPDLRGYGDSSYHHSFDSLVQLADDIKELLDRLSIKDISLLGWSLGGGVALEFASKYHQMVKKLILVSSTPHTGYPLYMKNTQLEQILNKPYKSKEELAKDPISVAPLLKALENGDAHFFTTLFDQIIYTGPNEPDQIMSSRRVAETLKQRCLVDADWALVNQNMSNTPSAYSKGHNTIKRITAEVLHLWGSHDTIVSKQMFEINTNALKERSSHIIYAKAGHDLIIDHLKVVTSDIYRFIKE